MDIFDRLVSKLAEEKRGARAAARGRRRAHARFGAVLGALAFALVVGSVTLVPAGRAAHLVPGVVATIAVGHTPPAPGSTPLPTGSTCRTTARTPSR